MKIWICCVWCDCVCVCLCCCCVLCECGDVDDVDGDCVLMCVVVYFVLML